MNFKLTQEYAPLNGDKKNFIWIDGNCVSVFTNDEIAARNAYNKAVQRARETKQIGERKTIQEDEI